MSIINDRLVLSRIQIAIGTIVLSRKSQKFPLVLSKIIKRPIAFGNTRIAISRRVENES